MKTYFLDQGEFVGGAECFLIDFLNSLSEKDCQQIQPIIIGGKSQNYKDRLQNDKVQILDFSYPQVAGGVFAKLLHLVSLRQTAKKLMRLTKGKSQKRFFSNTPRTTFVMYLAKKIFRIKGKWIVMFHDFTIPDFLLRQICKNADILIANSTPMRNHLRKIIPKSHHHKIRIIENGINFEKTPNAIVLQKLSKILVLGRIDKRKGQKYALEVAILLQEKRIACKFDFIGSSVSTQTREYERSCNTIAIEKKLENIRFLPETKKVFETINKYDLVLFLPTEPETFGRVVIEALAMNKMVLSFDITGPREILQNYYYYLGRKGVTLKENPFLIPLKNSKKLAERIIELVKNPEICKTLSENGRDFVEKNYNLKETKKRLLEIL